MKIWLKYTLLSVIMTYITFCLFNYFMDPLWTFEHKHSFNEFQRGHKERQQKSHSLYFRSQLYNTLLLGSSRTTFMDQNLWFEPKRTFNYAVSDMQPHEYLPYLSFAIETAKHPVKRVVIGLDFFGALEYRPHISTQFDTILSPITQPFYRWKLLSSFNALDYSLKNIKYYFKQHPHTYTWDNVKHFPSPTSRSRIKFDRDIAHDVHMYEIRRYNTPYDDNYKKTLLAIKQKYPNIEFLVYTTPVSQKQFELLSKTHQYKNYERWLKEATEVFETVHHFMYINEYTKYSEKYFNDSNHPQKAMTICIANQIQKKQSECAKTDFIINTDKIEEQLKELRIKNGVNGSK